MNDLATLGPLTLMAMKEFVVTLVCTPVVYGLFYQLYRKSGGKPV